MILIKEKGFTTLECVISLFIISMIVFVMTKTLHNNNNLLIKNHHKRDMLYIAKEIIEDERIDIETYILDTQLLLGKVLEKENKSEIELDTYVFKKK